MGLVHFGVPERVVLFLKKSLGLKTFVETGTMVGGTAAWAAKHFEQVYTIEASEALWASAREKHRRLKNVEFIRGNSPEQIGMLIPHLVRPLFWLDAHWSGGNTAGKDAECPLLAELDVIANSGLSDAAILVDDARLFLCPPPSPHKWEQWPDISTVISAIDRCGDFFTVIKDDAIISIPKRERASFVGFLKE
jgi:hypothetical protein